MRVIAGTVRGRKLRAFRGRRIRPTADRAKEALFNIIADKVTNAFVLDLYAGTGSLGIEALSRGAKFVTLADDSVASVDVIRNNLELTEFSEQAKVLKGKAKNIIDVLSLQKTQFNLIFLDPPYKISLRELGEVFNAMAEGDILIPEGIVVLEHSIKREPPVFENFLLKSTRKYGDTALSFYILNRDC